MRDWLRWSQQGWQKDHNGEIQISRKIDYADLWAEMEVLAIMDGIIQGQFFILYHFHNLQEEKGTEMREEKSWEWQKHKKFQGEKIKNNFWNRI